MGWRHWLDLILPRRCAACSAPSDAPLCNVCEDALPWIPISRRCDLCQCACEPTPNAARLRPRGVLCLRCSAAPSPLTECRAALWLEGDVRAWIHRFKYPATGLLGLDPQARVVVRRLARAASRGAALPRPDEVVPIPLHVRRLRSRGFNPAGLLAVEIARREGVRVHFDWLVRLRDTPSQAGSGRSARQKNVAGAFQCRRRMGPTPRRVWLIDDVVTTGATLRAAAQVLRDAGVREVFALCAARTPPPPGHVDSAGGSS